MAKLNKGAVYILIGCIFLLIAGGWYLYNISEDKSAGKQSAVILEKLSEAQETNAAQSAASDVLYIEGEAFCGKLTIEKLSIELPVYNTLDYEKLESAPCRYAGSIASENIIIAAHNYVSHFGSLNELTVGDEIVFTDALGQKHCYCVAELEIIDGHNVSQMHSGGWDFTLFTCTKGGARRVTVRCQRT